MAESARARSGVGRAALAPVLTVNAARHLRRGAYDLIQSHAKLLWQDVYRAGDGCHREWLRVRATCQATPAGSVAACRAWMGALCSSSAACWRGRRYRLIVAISARVRADLIRHYAVAAQTHPRHLQRRRHAAVPPAARQASGYAARRRLEVPAGALLALFMGTGFERKGLVHLLRALPDAGEQMWLVVAGRDAEADSYRALARSLGIAERVRFLGPVRTRPALCRRRRPRAADPLRAVLQRLPGSHGLRPSGRHDAGRRRVGASA